MVLETLSRDLKLKFWGFNCDLRLIFSGNFRGLNKVWKEIGLGLISEGKKTETGSCSGYCEQYSVNFIFVFKMQKFKRGGEEDNFRNHS